MGCAGTGWPPRCWPASRCRPDLTLGRGARRRPRPAPGRGGRDDADGHRYRRPGRGADPAQRLPGRATTGQPGSGQLGGAATRAECAGYAAVASVPVTVGFRRRNRRHGRLSGHRLGPARRSDRGDRGVGRTDHPAGAGGAAASAPMGQDAASRATGRRAGARRRGRLPGRTARAAAQPAGTDRAVPRGPDRLRLDRHQPHRSAGTSTRSAPRAVGLGVVPRARRRFRAAGAVRARPLGADAAVRDSGQPPRRRAHAFGRRRTGGLRPVPAGRPRTRDWAWPRRNSRALAEDLASHGYVVAGVTPTYSANITVLHGQAVGPTPAGNPPDTDRADGDRLVAVWAADARFVAGRIADTGGVAGRPRRRRTCRLHRALLRRCRVAAGMPRRPALRRRGRHGRHPLRHGRAPGPDRADDAARHPRRLPRRRLPSHRRRTDRHRTPPAGRCAAASTGPTFRYEIAGAEHFNFTDYGAYYIPTPLHGLAQLGSIDGYRCLAIVSAYVTAFVDHVLRGARRTSTGPPVSRGTPRSLTSLPLVLAGRRCVGVPHHVVVGPQVERELHRPAIALAEQGRTRWANWFRTEAGSSREGYADVLLSQPY